MVSPSQNVTEHRHIIVDYSSWQKVIYLTQELTIDFCMASYPGTMAGSCNLTTIYIYVYIYLFIHLFILKELFGYKANKDVKYVKVKNTMK